MPFAIGPSSHVANDFSNLSRSRSIFLSVAVSSPRQAATHWTVFPLSSTSCRINPPSPTHPYCLFSTKYRSPSFSLAFSSGTRYRQSHQPAKTGSVAASFAPRTYFRTKPKIPSAPMSKSARSILPSWKRSSMPPLLPRHQSERCQRASYSWTRFRRAMERVAREEEQRDG